MQHSFPVSEVLLAQRSVKAKGVPRGGDIGGGRAFSQHLCNGITRDQVNQEKDKADHQPDNREGVKHALE